MGPLAERFVADEEIEQPVAVEVRPARGLARMHGPQKTRLLRHILERAVTSVPQQGVDLPLDQPTAAQDENIEIAVVIVVGLHEVAAAPETLESGRPSE